MATHKKRCQFGVSKTTGKCLKNKRPKNRRAVGKSILGRVKGKPGLRSCKYGVSKRTGLCLKRRRR